MNSTIKLCLYKFFFGLYIFFSIVSQRSIIGDITLIIFVLFTLIQSLILKRKIYFSNYFILEIIFIIYCVWQNFNEININPIASTNQIITLIKGLVFGIAVYNFVILQNNIKDTLNTYIVSVILGMSILGMSHFNTLISGRFNAAKTLKILGVGIGGHSATSLAYISGIAFFCSIILIYVNQDNKKKNYFYSIFLATILILTGTRKTLLLILVALLFIPNFKNKNFNLLKFLKNVLIWIICGYIFYITITKIPFLYEKIGFRIQNMIDFFLQGDSLESSLSSRTKFVNRAINAIRQRPYTGWGLDSFRTVFNDEGLYTHNNFLEILVSTGIVGFLIYYFKYILLLIKIVKSKIDCNLSERIYTNSFIILFVSLWILEYWQITFIYRTCIIINYIILGYLKIQKSKQSKTKNGLYDY